VPASIRVLRFASAVGQHGMIVQHRIATPAAAAASLSNHGRAWSADFAVNLVLRGSGVYIDDSGRRHALGPGSLFLRLPDQSHSSLIDASDYEESWLVVRAQVFMHLRGLGLVDTARPVRQLADPQRAERQFAFLAGLAPIPEVHASALWVTALERLAVLLSQACVIEVPPGPSWLDAAKRLLVEDLESDLPMTVAARRLGLDGQRFRKSFTAAVGVAPKAYRIQARIDRARRELLTDSVASVARSVGGGDPKHFSRLFRARTGLSPRQFQRLARARLPTHERPGGL